MGGAQLGFLATDLTGDHVVPYVGHDWHDFKRSSSQGAETDQQ